MERAGCDVAFGSVGHPLAAEELSRLAEDADALIVGNDAVNALVISSAPRLRVISRYGVGVDNIDVPAATRHGIPVTNTPGANESAVADLTVGLVICLARHIPDGVSAVRRGEWRRTMGSTLAGKTVGVIGLGRIGKAVVRRLSGFDVTVIAYDVARDDEFALTAGVQYVALDDLLARSDFVTIHVPLNSETRGLIGARELSLMKPSAFIVNTSRGEALDESSLFEALEGRRIAGAALDVLSKEPPRDSRLIALDNVIVTPHTGGHTREAIDTMGVIAATNVVDVLQGREARYTVNAEVYAGGRGLGPLRS